MITRSKTKSDDIESPNFAGKVFNNEASNKEMKLDTVKNILYKP